MQVSSRQRGVSLIEVLVAIVVFSVGVLGLAMIQIKGGQFTKDAGSRSFAVLETRSFVDAMRANPTAARKPLTSTNPAAPSASDCPYCFDGTTTPTVTDCSSSACTPEQTAANDLSQWMARLKASAPNAMSGVPVSVAWNAASGMYVITARWSGGSLDGSTPKAGDDLTYTINFMP